MFFMHEPGCRTNSPTVNDWLRVLSPLPSVFIHHDAFDIVRYCLKRAADVDRGFFVLQLLSTGTSNRCLLVDIVELSSNVFTWCRQSVKIGDADSHAAQTEG